MNSTLKHSLSKFPVNIYQDVETSQWMFTCDHCGNENILLDEAVDRDDSIVCIDCEEEIAGLEQDEELGKDLNNGQN